MKRIRKIGLTNFILLISSLLLVIFLITFSFIKNASSAEMVAHTWEVKSTIRSLSSSISEMKSRKLNFLYTQQIKYKHAYSDSREEYDSLLIVLEDLVKDNQSQLTCLMEVDSIVGDNFTNFENSINTAKIADSQIIFEGKAEVDKVSRIQAKLEKMVSEENKLLEERGASYERWKVIILIAIGVAGIIIFLSLYNLIKKVRPLLEELLETKGRLEQTNTNLKQTLVELNTSNAQKEIEMQAKNKAMEETEKLNVSLQVKNQQLDHFAYVASHDLQEPLRTVSNYLEIFQEDYPERLEGEATMYLDFINSAVERMRNLISGLLSFSRLGTSGQQEKINLNETIQKIKEDFSAVIEDRNIVIESQLLPTITGHKLEIKQLFQNLISNAIKFTKKDVSPHIEISFDETDGYYNFHIKDNGIGIPDKDFSKIFDMFSRLHSTKDYDGQGIGLAFCKKIVELHHGNIWVTSEFGKGSTLHFTLKK